MRRVCTHACAPCIAHPAARSAPRVCVVCTVAAVPWPLAGCDVRGCSGCFLGSGALGGVAGQAIAQVILHAATRREFILKAFGAPTSFHEESAQYSDEAHPLRRFLPESRAVVRNTDGAFVDARNTKMPPCIIMLKGVNMQQWLKLGDVTADKQRQVRRGARTQAPTACAKRPQERSLGKLRLARCTVGGTCGCWRVNLCRVVVHAGVCLAWRCRSSSSMAEHLRYQSPCLCRPPPFDPPVTLPAPAPAFQFSCTE